MRGLYFHLVHGMMEYWNVDFERKFIIYILHVNLNFPNKSTPHFSKTQYSIISVFQHSNWGKAPKL